MRRTNKIILMTLMISLLLLGIGYAAIQNITLSISGYAEVGAKADNFNVRFLEQVDITKNGFDNVIVDAQKTSDVTATINLSGLSKAGETITALYTVKNESPDLSADLTVSTSNDAPEYLTISSKLDKTSLVAGDETTVEVIVKVTKTPITDNIKAKIGVELIAMPVQPGEEGTSEGIKDFDQTPNSDGRNEFGYYYDRFYINEEDGIGFIAHSDYSCEGFVLKTTEEHPLLEKDDWFCDIYWGPGENDPRKEFENGGKVLDDGKKIICSYGEFILSDIVPHGIYKNNRYATVVEDGDKIEFSILDNGMINLNITEYDEEGEQHIQNDTIDEYLLPVANGYVIELFNEFVGSLNVTGDLGYSSLLNMVIKLEEPHDYISQITKDVTCTENGEITIRCNDCNDSKLLNVSAHNHKNDNDLNGVCDDCNEAIEYGYMSYQVGIMVLLLGQNYNVDTTDLVIPNYFYSILNKSWEQINKIYSIDYYNASNLKSIVIPDTVIEINEGAFEECYSLETINYTGTQEQWEQIIIEEGNDRLNYVTINFNYEIPKE